MPQYHTSIQVKSTQSDAWELLQDPAMLHHWAPLASPVRGVAHRFQQGDRFDAIAREFGLLSRHRLEVEEVLPPRRLVLRSLGRLLDPRATLSLEEVPGDPGSVRFDQTVEVSLGRNRLVQLLDRWALTPLASFFGGRRTLRSSVRFKAILESHPD